MLTQKIDLELAKFNVSPKQIKFILVGNLFFIKLQFELGIHPEYDPVLEVQFLYYKEYKVMPYPKLCGNYVLLCLDQNITQ